ncbi:hypothetical protein AF72_05435 [Xylella taiwanensis]|uniref:Uncharacterized protein n=1 Tax=Xylella taiwanensis TaxID=1444770 RepID=Z9JJB5_9GAMM|nr:hypothetical protein AF72_05435 [Xylella taiwanensis]
MMGGLLSAAIAVWLAFKSIDMVMANTPIVLVKMFINPLHYYGKPAMM